MLSIVAIWRVIVQQWIVTVTLLESYLLIDAVVVRRDGRVEFDVRGHLGHRAHNVTNTRTHEHAHAEQQSSRDAVGAEVDVDRVRLNCTFLPLSSLYPAPLTAPSTPPPPFPSTCLIEQYRQRADKR